MSSKTGEFGDYAGDVRSAQGKLDDFEDGRKNIVDGLKSDWQGDDYNSLSDDSDELTQHCMATGLKMDAAAIALQTGGAAMTAMVQAMESLDRTAKGIGYTVTPLPMALIGPRIQAQISAAGPGAPALLAAYQSIAITFSTFLRGLSTAITVQDNATGVGLQQITNSMRPLTSKFGLARPNRTPLQATEESLDFASDLRNQLAAEHERFMGLGLTHAERGPVLGAVMDKKTGKVYYGTNPEAEDFARNNDFHPALQSRIDQLKQNRVNYDQGGVVNHGEPGEHAEVLALNRALMARDPDMKNSNIDLGDFMVDNYKSAKKPNHTGFVRCCSNCMQVLQGVEGSGRGW
ncbi:YwqJ-related putative deaminase [Glycomyces luteolus]|uniref:YwqJ-related putative deaminase n=1 Tax=Glycomyces luteolus TaxID=2670330 RepID=A0A9X3T4Z3_9ACTN|nr:YwqJ-related putative deaminase [Glycomyces luteolus]MDA1361675.1 YwqJ-related putative deaminase [Glycomyces luteolus]